jgi:hypothetical protein
MHTIELIEAGLALAKRLGYKIRQEWLGGAGGGGCELKGRKIFFLDLALTPEEQLDQLLDTLRRDPLTTKLDVPSRLRELLAVRKIA